MTDETSSSAKSRDLRWWSVRTGWAGFLPAIFLVLWLTGLPDDHRSYDGTVMALVAYSAMILAFLGGIRWGLALAGGDDANPHDIAASALPVLAGIAAIALPAPYCFAFLAAALAAQGAWDAFSIHRGVAPEWFGTLRRWLTVAVVLALIVAFFVTA